MNGIALALVICIAGAGDIAKASDANGDFSIRGAGRISCAELLGGLEAKDKRLSVFAHWLEGYITASNQHLGDTFDVTPWQTTELLLALAGRSCAATPEKNFMDVVGRLIAQFRPLRVQEKSALVQLRTGESVQVHYRVVVERARTRLIELGHLFETQGLEGQAQSAEMRRNLLAFQKTVGLPPSGRLDQQTLLNLFVTPKAKN